MHSFVTSSRYSDLQRQPPKSRTAVRAPTSIRTSAILTRSLVAERDDRVEARGSSRGHEAEEDARHRARRDRDRQRDGVELHGPAQTVAQALDRGDAHDRAGQTADEREDDGLDEELGHDVVRARADRHADADLARS